MTAMSLTSTFLVLVTAAALLSVATAPVVQRCATGPSAVNVAIKGCTEEPCELHDTAVMDITFLAASNSYTLAPKVLAKVAGVEIPYPLPSELRDACKSLLNGYCPIEKGEVLVYHLEMPTGAFPKIAVTLEFSLIADNKEVFQCFRVDCQLT